MAKNEGQFEILPEDGDQPFGVQLRWVGHDAAEIGGGPSDVFFVELGERQCDGRSFVRDAEGRRILDQAGIVLTRPCTGSPMNGSNVCHAHGGKTPGALKAARERLENASNALVNRLIGIALSPNTLDSDAIKAINSALDRAGIRAGVEVSLETPEWQKMLAEMYSAKGEDAN